jgi:hypothetical protein
MQLFRKIRITFLRWAKEKKSGETDSLKDAFKGVVYGYALYYGSWLVLVLAGLAVLSFTSWLGGPYVAAQVIFFLIAGTVSIVAINIFWLWRAIKNGVSNFGTKSSDEIRDVSATDKADSEVHKIEVTDKSDN